MTFEPINSQQSFVPTTIILPDIEDGKNHNLILTDFLKKVIQAVNDKDIAQYALTEILCGQKFFTPNDNNKFRFVFRKVINFGVLPDSATKSVAHGIAVDTNTIFTRIYATATFPNTRFIPIPYINTTTPGDSVEIDVDSTNVNITTTTSNYTSFTICYVILEYIKG